MCVLASFGRRVITDICAAFLELELLGSLLSMRAKILYLFLSWSTESFDRLLPACVRNRKETGIRLSLHSF